MSFERVFNFSADVAKRFLASSTLSPSFVKNFSMNLSETLLNPLTAPVNDDKNQSLHGLDNIFYR